MEEFGYSRLNEFLQGEIDKFTNTIKGWKTEKLLDDLVYYGMRIQGDAETYNFYLAKVNAIKAEVLGRTNI